MDIVFSDMNASQFLQQNLQCCTNLLFRYFNNIFYVILARVKPSVHNAHHIIGFHRITFKTSYKILSHHRIPHSSVAEAVVVEPAVNEAVVGEAVLAKAVVVAAVMIKRR